MYDLLKRKKPEVILWHYHDSFLLNILIVVWLLCLQILTNKVWQEVNPDVQQWVTVEAPDAFNTCLKTAVLGTSLM